MEPYGTYYSRKIILKLKSDVNNIFQKLYGDNWFNFEV